DQGRYIRFGCALDLLDDLIRPRQYRGRDREAKRLGGLEVYGQMEAVHPLDRQISRVSPQQDALDVLGREVADCATALAVAGQAAVGDEPHGGQSLRSGGLDEQLDLTRDDCVRYKGNSARPPGSKRAQSRSQLFDRGHPPLDQLQLELASSVPRQLHRLL